MNYQRNSHTNPTSLSWAKKWTKMKNNTPITEIMTANFKTVDINESLKKAGDILFENKFKHLPVLKKGELVGIISKTDIKRMSFADELGGQEFEADRAVFEMLTVGQVMVKAPFVLNAETTVKDAAEVLSKKEFRSIPIVDNEKLVGIVTTKDLIRHLLTLL